MIPTIIIAGIVLFFIATANTSAPQTVDAAISSFVAPAALIANPTAHRSRPSNLRTDSGQVTTANNPSVPLGSHSGSVLAPSSRPRDPNIMTGSVSSSGNYVPPPANNPAISRPETRPDPVVTPEPRKYTAPVSVSSVGNRR